MKLHVHIFYEVENGDTGLDIMTRFDMPIGELIKYNPQFSAGGVRNLSRIFIGELIRIQ